MGRKSSSSICNPGYMPAHFRASVCTKMGIRGIWEPTPECEIIKCKLSLPPPRGTRYDPPFRNLFSPGDTVRVICDESHLQESPAVATCKQDGEWTSMPRCNGVTCNRQDVRNADVVNVKQKYIYGEQANYVCTNDHVGHFSLTCMENGWNGNLDCRVPLDCGKPTFVEDADVRGRIFHSYRHNERVEYVCYACHILQGDHFKTCQDGTWTGTFKCLKPCMVTREALNAHNIEFKDRQRSKLCMMHDDAVEFRCTKGNLVGSMDMRQYCADGIISLPSCI